MDDIVEIPVPIQFRKNETYKFNYSKFLETCECYTENTKKRLKELDGKSIMISDSRIGWLIVSDTELIQVERAWLDIKKTT